MNTWSHGYNVSQGYTYGFYRELSPDWLDLAARLNGYATAAREDGGAAFRYLELGCGQGMGLCLLAGAYPGAEFVGVDFNPEHVAHARALAADAGLTNVRFVEGDFAVLGADWPADLGRFHYAVLHGIYTWIPAAVREGLVQCLDKAVLPSALVYVSYNCMPGWAPSLPFQHMLRRLQVVTAKSGPEAIKDGIALFEALEAAGGALNRVLPSLKARVDGAKTQSVPYLIQEYLHERWRPMWFSEVAGDLAASKLGYVGSATASEILLPHVLPAALRDLISAQADPVFREELQDSAINQTFRRDLFCRGPRRDFVKAESSGLDDVFHLLAPVKDEELKVKTAYGELSLKAAAHQPIVEALGEGPKSIAELAALPGLASRPSAHTVQTLCLLLHGGQIAVGQRQAPDPASGQALNRAVARGVVRGAPYANLCMPALGSAVSARDVDMLLLDAWLARPSDGAQALGAALVERLGRLNRKLVTNGKAAEGEDATARGAALAADFLARSLPLWRRLQGVV